MQKRSSKRKDTNQTAYDIVKQIEAVSEGQGAVEGLLGNEAIRKQVMQEMGRKGGLKGGRARAASMTAARRKEIAQKAAATRWKKD